MNARIMLMMLLFVEQQACAVFFFWSYLTLRTALNVCTIDRKTKAHRGCDHPASKIQTLL